MQDNNRKEDKTNLLKVIKTTFSSSYVRTIEKKKKRCRQIENIPKTNIQFIQDDNCFETVVHGRSKVSKQKR